MLEVMMGMMEMQQLMMEMMSNPPRILMAINIGALLAGLGHTSACYSF
jgi:hypothetical protein